MTSALLASMVASSAACCASSFWVMSVDVSFLSFERWRDCDMPSWATISSLASMNASTKEDSRSYDHAAFQASKVDLWRSEVPARRGEAGRGRWMDGWRPGAVALAG